MSTYECLVTLHFDYIQDKQKMVLFDVDRVVRFNLPKFVKGEPLKDIVNECVDEFYEFKGSLDIRCIRVKTKNNNAWVILYKFANFDHIDPSAIIHEIPKEMVLNIYKEIMNDGD